MTENSEFGRKPLPIQRILSENVQSSSRLKSGSKPELKCQISRDKENSKDGAEETEGSHSTPDDTVDNDWGPEAAPLSSTMALGANSTPNFFSGPTSSNVSSINCSDALSISDVSHLSQNQIPENHFKTPSRKMNGADPDLTPSSSHAQDSGTPRTPRWVTERDRTPSSGPGSGSQRTPLSSSSSRVGHNMRTPSTGASYKTPSGTKLNFRNALKTPGSGGSHSAASGDKNDKTPSSGSSSSTRWNPFDSHSSEHNMLNPTMSPNVFSVVMSPSQESGSGSGGFWNLIDEIEMYPVEISEESPYKQSIYNKSHNKDKENRTQEQIDQYWAERHDVTSPPDLPATKAMMIEGRDGSFSGLRPMANAWTQTNLPFPPVLPAEVEAIIKQYTSLTDQMCQERPVSPPPSSLSNSTIRRRKLKFNAGTASESSRSRSTTPETDPESEDCDSVPDIQMTPGKVFNTPQSARRTLPSDAWSSSPVRSGQRTVNGVKTNFCPPDQMGSPMFSPIVRGRRYPSQNRSSSEGEESSEENEVMETTDRSPDRSGRSARRSLVNDLTSASVTESVEMYLTAEIDCGEEEEEEEECDGEEEEQEEQGEQETGSPQESHMSMEVDSATRDVQDQDASMATMSQSVIHVGDNWTLSTVPEDAEEMEGGSKADTGYGESHNTASPHITNITPGSASTSRQDSGVTPSTNVTDNTCGLSAVAPPASTSSCPVPGQNVLMSYHAGDNSNDISVGFPLGSSTPTKLKNIDFDPTNQ